MIPKPFFPVREESEGLNHIVTMTKTVAAFGADSLPYSLIADGHELLAAPVRLGVKGYMLSHQRYGRLFKYFVPVVFRDTEGLGIVAGVQF